MAAKAAYQALSEGRADGAANWIRAAQFPVQLIREGNCGCDTAHALKGRRLLVALLRRPWFEEMERGYDSLNHESWQAIPWNVSAIRVTCPCAVPSAFAVPCRTGSRDGFPLPSAAWERASPPAFASLSIAR